MRSKPAALLAAAVVGMCGACSCASQPDRYEGSEFEDGSSTTTRNVLSEYNERNPDAQKHTLHSESDVDWGMCAPQSEGTTFPYSLRFTDLVIPPDSYLVVELWKDGTESEPGMTEHISSYNRTVDVSWLGSGKRKVFFSVKSFGKVEPMMSYSVSFVKNTGGR